ncbi:MAG: lipopolysaccharide kinase InaA family protein [Gammaproteobacteria bacterium]
MREYKTSDWEQLAASNKLDSFDTIWALDIGWFEAPNQRRGGWSGVSQTALESADGRQAAVFIKRQQDHFARTPAHPLAGVLTFRREFHNLSLLHACGVPTLEVLYFAERKLDGKRQSILVSRALSGYRSLDVCLQSWQQTGWPSRVAWHRLLQRLAGFTRLMHRNRIQHNCLFPKHVFLSDIEAGPDIRLIDLEKAKRVLSVERAMLRDLDTLNRRTLGVTRTDRLRFLLAYYGQPRVDQRVRKTWKKLTGLMRRKGYFPADGQ